MPETGVESPRLGPPPPPDPDDAASAYRPPLRRALLQPGMLLVASIGACAYIASVDPNHSSAYPQCPTKLLTGLDCPLCGATRAVHSLLRGSVVGAMDHNLLFVLAIPAILYTYVAWTASLLGRPMKPIPFHDKRVWIPLAVITVAFTVVRNLPAQPYHWLNSATSA
jgi:hypothetical protein